jgi:hypothetical protein
MVCEVLHNHRPWRPCRCGVRGHQQDIGRGRHVTGCCGDAGRMGGVRRARLGWEPVGGRARRGYLLSLTAGCLGAERRRSGRRVTGYRRGVSGWLGVLGGSRSSAFSALVAWRASGRAVAGRGGAAGGAWSGDGQGTFTRAGGDDFDGAEDFCQTGQDDVSRGGVHVVFVPRPTDREARPAVTRRLQQCPGRP